MNDASAHRHTWDQIPWLVNGTLPQAERQAVEVHLDACADCRAEYGFQRSLANSLEVREPACEIDPIESWKGLQARIDGAGRSAKIRSGSHRVRAALSGGWIPWLVAAMVVQAIALSALATVIWSKPATPSVASGTYRTLSSPEQRTGSATIRVVFAPDMSVGQLQSLLTTAGLQLQSGPSSAGVWSLEPARDSNRSATQSALRALRENPEVRFAEVIGGSP